MTTAQTQTNATEIARLKTIRAVAVILAVASFLTLVYGFGEQWPAMYQVTAGLVAYAFVEWQRYCSRKIKGLGGAADR